MKSIKNYPISDTEFEDLLNKLYRIALNSGDIGFEYWFRVIKQLEELYHADK